MIGKSHLETNEICQDFVMSAVDSDTCVIVLADGAGTATRSLIGAKTVSSLCAKWLLNHFEEEYDSEYDAIKKHLKKRIDASLRRKAKRLDINKKELSSTLLFVAISNQRYIAGHIGDGVIGASMKGVEEVLSNPERGEFANNTFFTTSPNLLKHIRVQKGILGDINSFYLMSDGSADCLYLPSESRFAPAVGKLSAALSADFSSDCEDSNLMLKNVMEKHFRAHTSDDCSFIMVQW